MAGQSSSTNGHGSSSNSSSSSSSRSSNSNNKRNKRNLTVQISTAVSNVKKKFSAISGSNANGTGQAGSVVSPSQTGQPKGRTFVKNERHSRLSKSNVRPPGNTSLIETSGTCQRVWSIAALIMTCCVPSICLTKCCKKSDKSVRHAWREKVALCMLSFLMCCFLCYFTFFFQKTTCPPRAKNTHKITDASKKGYLKEGKAILFGNIYPLGDYVNVAHPPIYQMIDEKTKQEVDRKEISKKMTAVDLSYMFYRPAPSCEDLVQNITEAKSCNFKVNSDTTITHCHSFRIVEQELKRMKEGSVYYEWYDIIGSRSRMAYNGKVMDLKSYIDDKPELFSKEIDKLIRANVGKDVTLLFNKNTANTKLASCLIEMYYVGDLDEVPMLCMTSNFIQNVALVIICGLVLTRFFLAWAFAFALSRQLGKIAETRSIFSRRPKEVKIVSAVTHPQEFTLFHSQDFKLQYKELYTFCFVTCYSEGADGLKTTMDSLARTDYSDQHKCIVIVADGVVKGSGNDKPTGDIILDMIELDEAVHGQCSEIEISDAAGQSRKTKFCVNAEPQMYEAIATGPKKVNMAKVYCGTYLCDERRVAVILVYKCGTPAEVSNPKPGNRGKRDSQVILMDFLSKIMFNERLSPLQFDMFTKISHIMTVQNLGTCRITPDMFEIVLMVDADTKVMPDSLSRMVAVMQRDPTVMGLCGETKIMNKNESFISMMQVFEYYSSHHLAKAFESIFGGVTCLPGCFCMYRIKSPKPVDPTTLDPRIPPEAQCLWIPVLANPDIVHDYSVSVVDTLHKKNLLLLGEDRYLSTLMLRTFPKRKMMFVPKAICKTQVPASFWVLLSQRRRWINSTIHNLMELVLVRELCGTFCFSMQFVVLLELIGTVTLPAAIIFTMVVIIYSIVDTVAWVPLLLLAAILGLPAILILITSSNPPYYLFYMLVYLISLPIWNFVLPTYAFWHFDDFSWGQTRQVAGEKKGEGGHGHDDGGDSSSSVSIPLKQWSEWERIRRKALEYAGLSDPIGTVTKFIDQTPKIRKKSSKLTIIAEKLGLSPKPDKKDGPQSRPTSAPNRQQPSHQHHAVRPSLGGIAVPKRPQTSAAVAPVTEMKQVRPPTVPVPSSELASASIEPATPLSAQLRSRPVSRAANSAPKNVESPNPFSVLSAIDEGKLPEILDNRDGDSNSSDKGKAKQDAPKRNIPW